MYRDQDKNTPCAIDIAADIAATPSDCAENPAVVSDLPRLESCAEVFRLSPNEFAEFIGSRALMRVLQPTTTIAGSSGS